MRAEINELEMKKKLEKINETKSWFFEKINLLNFWPDLSGKKGRGVNKIRSEKKRSYYRHHRNTKDHERLLQGTIC